MQIICAMFCALIFSDVCVGSTVPGITHNHHGNKQKVLRKKSEIRYINGLECAKCETKWCMNVARLRCKGGFALDLCECCTVCAKVENEYCGGKHNHFGTCDEGLDCSYAEALIMDVQDTAAPVIKGICRPRAEKEEFWPDSQNRSEFSGVPQLRTFLPKSAADMDKIKELFTQSDDPAPAKKMKSKCQPQCSPEYCKKNPRAICSAVDNADETRPCQTSCQHTSCMACRFTNADPEACPSCGADNFQCIKRYGRCIRKQQCWRRKFPCNAKAMLENNPGKFQCLIPECP